MKLCPQCGTANDDDARWCAHCGAATDDQRSDALVGRTVGGAYLLQELIGVGGMGRVYRAEQNMLGRTVAVKVIHPRLLGDDQTVARFYNEARAASRLNHPDSVSIIDFGRTEDGILYLVMEYLAGKDLSHVLAEEGPLPFVRVCRVLRHVLSALGEAHALGVVHRDLKPENIIVRRVRRGTEQIKVVDFGLAHIVGPGGTSITTPGLVCGTPDYMSPEQGRGELVDGRGDLYSVGVMLFEMLTDRLPYEDETPTKVVFRHIHDPVPDPREVAAQRAIPDDLAEICLRALRKRASERFQSADEMYEALGKVEQRLEAIKTGSISTCPVCNAQNPAEQRFCGSCGGRLTDKLSIPANLRSGPPNRGSLLPPAAQSRMVGRASEVERLLELREQSAHAATWVRVLGEPGAGKTRLLSDVGHRCAQLGDAVVMASPHPSGAPVPYWPIRQLVCGLLDVNDQKLAEIASGHLVGDPIARAGIAEVLDPKGLEGCFGESRADAVSVALAAAVRVAAGRSASGRVVLFVDDLYRCDALSADVVARAIERLHDDPLLLVTASIPQREGPRSDASVKLQIRGLSLEDAARLMAGGLDAETEVDRELDTQPAARLMLPLYLEQLRALGVVGLEADETLPPRLADAVIARLERLDVASRRLLQVVAVLGDSAPLEWVRELSRGADLGALETLRRDGLVTVEGDRVVFCHPFVRELVESSIPAEHRKELHTHALQVAAANGAALEVRADHAWRAGEPMSALLLLERMGDSALRRGDAINAVLAFRRGLELARRELLLTGETALDRAIVTFSRKLGDALDRAGDAAGADGVLREALELAGPANRERSKMLLLLSRVAVKRNRHRDATRFLGQALELGARQNDPLAEAEAHVAIGRLRLADEDSLTAANTLAKAFELAQVRGGEVLAVEAALLRADALTSLDDFSGAADQLGAAKSASETTQSKALIARVIAAQASLTGRTGDPDRATALFREAAQLASEAGDAERWREWQRLGGAAPARRAG